jgi:hypothetical protein
VCYDAKNAFVVAAPRGWVTDYDKRAALGLCVLFYPGGATFDDAPAVVYPSLVATDEPLARFIEGDLERFTKDAPSAKVDVLPPVTTAKGLRFELRRLSGARPPTEQEVIAYHAAAGGILLAVLSARGSDQRAKFEDAFRDFLEAIAAVPRPVLYKTMAAHAGSDLKKPGAAAYESEFMTAIAPRFAKAMGTCARGGSKNFAAVLQISSEGAILDWFNEIPNAMAECVRSRMKSERGPPPPFAPFHFQLDMKVTN